MSVSTIYQKAQAAAVLNACIMLVLFLLEGFFGFDLIEWWVDSWGIRFFLFAICWFVAPYIFRALGIEIPGSSEN